MPVTQLAKTVTSCPNCGRWISIGTKISKDLQLDAWLHSRCWFRRNNAKWLSKP